LPLAAIEMVSVVRPAAAYRAAFVWVRMQRVQTSALILTPALTIWVLCRLGMKRRRVCTFE
jgi:hypothetical protein